MWWRECRAITDSKRCGASSEETQEKHVTRLSSGVKGEVRQRAAVHSVVRVRRAEAAQKITNVSEMKTSITDRVRICEKITKVRVLLWGAVSPHDAPDADSGCTL